ncbi:hypothetical protein [Gracilibacillus boraciitolerans]|nr:hypothetical protein [Gracilibacillus boraciitolerans]
MEIQMPSYGRWEKLISNISGSIAPINSLLQTSTDIGAYELAIWKKKRI